MREPNSLSLPKWPFLTGDLLLLAAAAGIFVRSSRPLTVWEMAAMALCTALAALCGMLPYILEFNGQVKLTESGSLENSLNQLHKIESVANAISTATGQWQNIQGEAQKTAAAARQITERMATELKDFTTFLENANNTERSNLRLELDKFRRAETEWMQVLIRLLDHVYALHQGAMRSGQANVLQQVDKFQSACRDTVRRLGLVPFQAGPNDKFNPDRHRLLDEKATPPQGALVEETLATGFTYQGRLLRPALVKLRENGATAANADQSQLPLAEGQ